MEPTNSVTPESSAELDRVHKLAEALGIRFEEIVRSGSQGTAIGIQSKSILLSQRLDSRTVFVQDARFGAGLEAGTLDAPEKAHLELGQAVLEKLGIPPQEVASASVLSEMTQQAEYDATTGKARKEKARPGKSYASFTRQIEKLPVWSSRVIVGFTREKQIGFLEAHWPEIPQAVLEEGRRLAERLEQGWRPPEQLGAKVREIAAGIIHSPAAGFVMDIYPAIRVIYGSDDDTYSKRATAYLDRHGNPVPVPRQFDLAAEPPVKRAEVIAPGEPPAVELKRINYRHLLLSSPDVLSDLQGNRSYEELGCVGYQPQLRTLEAIVFIKRHSGYGGGLCSPGTPEFVRFYLSFDDGATWQDQGITSFTAWDIPFTGDRLEYGVSLRIDPNEVLCWFEVLPRVRAILEWNNQPPPNTPDHVPHWGNVRDARIQIGKRRWPIWREIFDAAKIKLSDQLQAIVDLDQPAQLKQKSFSAVELIDHYQGKGVPPHRFLAKTVKQWVANPSAMALPPAWKVDWSSVIGELAAINGNTTYEQLTCVGLDPNSDRLLGTINVKLPNGFSGGLCTAGSQEYVAFWIDYGGGWTYAGTTSVNVYDLTGIPLPEGLQYAVFLPVDFSGHRAPCSNGPVTARVRAILSWNDPPDSWNPNFVPTWGNRIDTQIHIKPGPHLDVSVPFLSRVGDVDESLIAATGKATGATHETHLALNDSPFGGRITLAGLIAFPTSTMKYRIMRKPNGASDSAYAPLGFAPLDLTLDTFNIVTGWTQTQITVTPDGLGYYAYQNYSSEHAIEGNLMGEWQSTSGEDGLAFDLRIDVSTDGNPAHDLHSNVVTVLVDNTLPTALLDINLAGGVQCADFAPGATFNGHYTATDTHFQSFSFEIQPSGPPNNPPHGVLPVPASGTSVLYGGTIPGTGVVNGLYTLNTGLNPGPPPTGPMDPCGYALILHVWDRTNVNSGGGYHHKPASVGFCLQTEME